MGKQDTGARADGDRGVGGNAAGIGDDAVLGATGRPRDEWFALLDEAGATGWKHQAIANWLVTEHGVDSWWAQAVTVGFEQARGIRLPGQRQDGTFEVSVTRTISGDVEPALRALAAVVTAQTGVEPLALNLAAKYPTARFPLGGGEFLLASASVRGAGKTSIGLVHGRMANGDDLADAKQTLRSWLAAVTVDEVG
ncbi:hypothetical protein BJY17_003453 [Agromyces hippuratus]|uniref:DUF4287 domain-containing protein n=1 Tax=Agromyces hippuratus TaxID=286438 RepID=A0A852WX69_9MICO|nr:DUF4287 domain-containing protein [Agromyces hippuratus]NYG22706.1 hypothetical protein [Agromyces hippuratus]